MTNPTPPLSTIERAVRVSQTDRERELSAELQKRSGRAPQGFFVPLSVFHQPVEQRVITIGLPAGGPGSNIIATDLMAGQFIDRLGAKMRVRQLGARVIAGLVGDVAIPRLEVSATSGWVAENAALSTSDMEVEQVSLKPKHAGANVEFSRNMLQPSTPNIEQLVRDDFAAILAEAVDDVAIEGGAAKQPTGVTKTVRIGNADIGVRRLEPPRRRRRLPPGGAGDMTATAVSSLPISLPPYGLTRPQAALRHTKKVHDLELTQKQEERERYLAQLEDSEFKEREPFEHFAEFLLGNSGLGAYERVEIYERLIRHLKNCKLTKLTVALKKMKAEWDAEDEQETA